MDVTEPYKSIWFGDSQGPTPYKSIGLRWAFISQTPVLSNRKRGTPTVLRAAVSRFVSCRIFAACGRWTANFPSRVIRVIRWAAYKGPAKVWFLTLGYAIMVPGRKLAFRAGFWQDCYRENNEIGPPAGR